MRTPPGVGDILLRDWGLDEALKDLEADRTLSMKTLHFTRMAEYSDLSTIPLLRYWIAKP